MRQHKAFPKEFDIDRLELAIEALQTLSLLDIVDVPAELHEMQPAITVHNLVLEANRVHLAAASKSTQDSIFRTAVKIIEIASERVPEDRANHHWWSLLYPHIMWMLGTTEAPPKDIAEPLLNIGLRNFSYMHLAMRRGSKEAARALRSLSAQLDPKDPLRLAARHRYAYACLSGIPQAMEFRDLYRTKKEVLGETHYETLMSHHNWALSLVSSGHYKEAEKEFRKVLASRRATLGIAHAYTLGTHWNLIDCLERQRDGASRADSEWEDLYRIVAAAENPGLVDLSILHYLGHWLDSKERYVQAEDCYRTIINALDVTPTEGNSFCESMRHCLAQNLIRQGRLDDSANTYHARLRHLEQTQEPTSEAVLSMRHDYADGLVDVGRNGEVEQLMRSVLEVRLAGSDRAEDIRIPSEIHCLMHFLESQDDSGGAIEVAKLLVRMPEISAWSLVPQLRKDITCVSRTLAEAGQHEEAVEGFTGLLGGTPEGSRDSFLLQRRLALTQYMAGTLDQEAFEERLQSVINALESRFDKEGEELQSTRDLLSSLRGDVNKQSGCSELED
ncbi:tetratricopeptide repeat protein [Streptomyces sp. NPDC059558]|uniref:tetratricopeptide repeat protein n=1 Tax=unclassified Streptomyces TaxID=2593676 RepID=UPI0036B86F25